MSDLTTKIDRITPELVAMAAWQTGLPVVRKSWGRAGKCGCPLSQIIMADPHGREIYEDNLVEVDDDGNVVGASARSLEELDWLAELTVVEPTYDEGFIHGVDALGCPYFDADVRDVGMRGYRDGVAVGEALQLPVYDEVV